LSPYETIAQKYFDHPQEAPFGDYVEWFLRNGYVISNPEYFVMGKNCRRLAPVEHICDCTHVFDEQDSDCWYVFAMAGNLQQCIANMPYELPWIAFERLIDNKRDLRFYETADIKRLTVIN
jgi:hypothetical protein